MIKPEDELQLSPKDRKSSSEIITIIAKVLSTEPCSISRLSRKTKEIGKYISDESIERHLKLILQVNELFGSKEVLYKEQTIGGRIYKEAWITE
ncbi:MAG: hypothetical protein ACTSO7_13710 [Candidatus Heimdallarchaeota archaeon]